MRPETRVAFNAFLANQERLNEAAPGAVQGFNVTPSIQQKLESKIQETSDFLSTVNIVPVTELQGDKLGLGVSGPIASRTDTSGGIKRTPRDPQTLDSRGYTATKTNSDTLVKYATLDTWAKFPDFQARLRAQVVQQQALDRILIGFNGASVAPTTDILANPLLQDVNRGWLQAIREEAPAQRMAHGEKDAAAIYVDAAGGGDYNNLDALVYDATMLLKPWARDDTRLVAITGRELMHDKYFPLINSNGDQPVQTLAGQQVLAQRRIGNLPARAVPYVPANAILITPLSNLSIYYQEGARRSRTVDRPELDQIETYESSNDAYVVENYDYVALIENIHLGPKA